MADKQMIANEKDAPVVVSETVGIPDSSPVQMLESKLHDLKTNYSDVQLKHLLGQHGLDKTPLTVHTRNIVLKKLAMKMLNFEPSDLTQSTLMNSKEGSVEQEPCKKQNEGEANDTRERTNQENLQKTVQIPNINTQLQSQGYTTPPRGGPLSKTHYIVCIPGATNSITVHSDFREVLKLMKEHKTDNPRMMSFPSLVEAETYASQHSADEVCQGALNKSSYPEEKAEVELAELKLFPSLSTPQLNQFRIYLEKGNINAAMECILVNPRYLIQKIDMPTILKEGPRYNALHASVIAGQLESCRLVMGMISDVEYLRCLYETQKRAEENSERLIDLYLNTPDRVANKTPLHLASERGYVEIVAFLVSFKACIRNFNRHIHEIIKKGNDKCDNVMVTGETPEEVACSRYRGSSAASVRAKIVELIQGGTCYVPLIRSDTTGPYAKVGLPYTPSSPYKLVSEIEGVLKPAPVIPTTDVDTKDFRNMKVWAFAGPMSPKEAEAFRRAWSSPKPAKLNHVRRDNLKIIDGDRGFERFGRELADCHSTSWQEYWPFLDAFADLRSEEGLTTLNLFFQKLQVVSLMQAVVKQEFVPAPAYHIGPEYILTEELSDHDSEEENVYFSADSPSSSEEDDFNQSRLSEKACTGVNENVSLNDSQASVSRGVLSSIWHGVVKLKNVLWYSLVKDKQAVESGRSNAVTSNKQECGDVNFTKPPTLDNNGCPNSRKVKNTSKEENVLLLSTDQLHGGNSLHGDNSLQGENSLNSDETVVQSTTGSLNPGKTFTKLSPRTQACRETGTSDSKSKTDTEPKTPDKWNYRSHISGSESCASSPDKDFSDRENDSSFQSPIKITPHKSKSATNFTSPVSLKNVASLSEGHVPDSRLNESFNTKMNYFADSLQRFSILSPKSSTTMPSTLDSREIENTFPSLHLFIGKLFSKFVLELKSRQLLEVEKPKSPSLMPVLFLRQAADDNSVLADVLLPETPDQEDTLLRPQSQVLDESSHKQLLKRVWNNLLVVVPSSAEAKRILSLPREELVLVLLEGVTQDIGVYHLSHDMNEVENLKDLYMKQKGSLDTPAEQPVSFYARVVRCSTLPSRHIFVCGSVPTKVDADVYHTLNNKACQLLQDQPSRFPLVAQWYDHMNKQGQDHIDSLPSPSQVLRSATFRNSRHSDSLVRNLFQ